MIGNKSKQMKYLLIPFEIIKSCAPSERLMFILLIETA